eukprot:GAHX01004055.1.p1 GENE.GAHX01004055.1~~GAHX01004055.1.p1  ORF type:complete len:95 (-),score=8.59 GAHX01004055.1:31-315(-)
MRDKLALLCPGRNGEKSEAINRAIMAKKQQQTKKHFDARHRTFKVLLKPGSQVRVKDYKNKYGPMKIVETIGKTSIITTDDKKWPLYRVVRVKY